MSPTLTDGRNDRNAARLRLGGAAKRTVRSTRIGNSPASDRSACCYQLSQLLVFLLGGQDGHDG